MAADLVSSIQNPLSNVGDWILRCIGYTTIITEDDVLTLVEKWSKMCDAKMPTLHIFKKNRVVNISVSSGVLIRPIRLLMEDEDFKQESPIVGTMCVYPTL